MTVVEAPLHFGCALHVHWCRDCEIVPDQHWNKQGTVSHSQCTPPQCKWISFGIKNESEIQGQSSPELIGILTVLKCICGPDLEILTWIGAEWWCAQAQNGVNFEFEVKFDLEGQGQSARKTIGILTKVFYTFGSNLVILAWTSDKLSRGQTHDWRPHGQTPATTIPEGQNWPRVKIQLKLEIYCTVLIAN